MPLQIVHQDITKMNCDAIVNPTDRYYSGGGGADLAIHRAAGPQMEEACRHLKAAECGSVEVTPGFDLAAKYVIHTVGPVWEGGTDNEPVLLRSCYMNALIQAKLLGCESIAFPLIASGTFGFPKNRVLRIAADTVRDFLFAQDSDMDVFICVINKDDYELSRALELDEYLARNESAAGHGIFDEARRAADHAPMSSLSSLSVPEIDGFGVLEEDSCMNAAPALEKPKKKEKRESRRRPEAASILSEAIQAGVPAPSPKKEEISLEDFIKKCDDTFAVMLLKLIDKKKMDEVDCYKKANINKQTFYKINNDPKYRPSKPTVVAFALALELNMEETETLLRSAGFALTRNDKFDLIIRYYIENGIYDIFEINEALYKYDQTLLGSGMKKVG